MPTFLLEDATRIPLPMMSVEAWSAEEQQANIDAIIGQANAWRAPGAMQYISEIRRRVQYLKGDVLQDLKDALSEIMPGSHAQAQKQPIALRLVEYITGKRARVFRGSGQEFGLRSRSTAEQVPEDSEPARIFQQMVEGAQLITRLIEADKVLDLCHDLALVLRWSDRRQRVEVSVFGPHVVHVAPDPEIPWDVDASRAIAVERTGSQGIGTKRFDIWANRDEEIPEGMDGVLSRSMHYTHDEKLGTGSVNEGDENPFLARITGDPIYPISWWQDYDGAVYSGLGGDTLVEMNRAINIGLTWLNYNSGWEMAPVPVLECSPGQEVAVEKVMTSIVMAPGKVNRFPAGVTLSFVKPGFDPRPFNDLHEMLIQYTALTAELSPRHLDIKGGLPQSGVALQIELSGLLEYREDRVRIYQPLVEDLLEKMIVVHNTYCEQSLRIPDELVPYWVPGVMDVSPEDPVALGDQYEREIQNDVSTPVDWIMERHQLNREDAEARYAENVERNAERSRQATRYPSPFNLDAGGEQPDEEPEEEQDDEPEEEGA